VPEKVLDEDLFSDGVDASEVAAELEATLLCGVVGRRALEDAVSRAVVTAAGEPAPLRPATFPRHVTTICTIHTADHSHQSSQQQ